MANKTTTKETTSKFELITPEPMAMCRHSAGIVICNDKGEVLVFERHDIANSWQFPQGGIDDKEDTLAGARRELQEETGLSAEHVELLGIHRSWLNYTWDKIKVDKLIGQTQKWFLFKLISKDDEKNINLNTHSQVEFSNWKWVKPEWIVDNVIDFRKEVYQEVIKGFERQLNKK